VARLQRCPTTIIPPALVCKANIPHVGHVDIANVSEPISYHRMQQLHKKELILLRRCVEWAGVCITTVGNSDALFVHVLMAECVHEGVRFP
jgi:hypothetical protein